MLETLILGGGSLKNKDWVLKTQSELQPEVSSTPLIFEAWVSNQDVAGLNFDLELDKALKIIGDRKFNLLVKSVGSMLGMRILERIGNQVEKIIVCGFPIKDFTAEELARYKVLASFPTEMVLCFQNSNDNHGSYNEARALLDNINPTIKLIKKEASDHNYPYSQDFKEFLSN